jgi:hypothetical protein
MIQHDFVLSLHEQSLRPITIQAKLVELFGSLVMSYSAITITFRMLICTAHEGEPLDLRGRRPNWDHDARILAVLAADPIASVRKIARKTQIPKSIVYNILVQRLGYCSRKFRLVSHEFDKRRRIERVDKARALFVTLNKAQKRAWYFILTDNESWLFYYTERDSIWLPPDVEAPEVARRLINTPKIMVTVFWNLTGIHVFDCLPKDRSFNAAYFIGHIFSKIEKMPDVRAAMSEQQKVVLHMDDLSIYSSKAVIERIEAISFEFPPDSPYSQEM